MTDLSTQRRLAASILKVGVSRVYIDPEHLDDVEEAITRDDVRSLIKMGLIEARPTHTPSRGRKRLVHVKKSKGKRKGHGSRKGGRNVRRRIEESWTLRVRKQRAFLRGMYKAGKVSHADYRQLYMKIKGGVFPSLSSLKNTLAKGA
ncbi:MAG: 50S ribosomal protein L19e [Candidatus Marsarchaeota archaeon]|nr:50S ribosomal protein L19e [Candidatus Marsarchaeota archaeon]